MSTNDEMPIATRPTWTPTRAGPPGSMSPNGQMPLATRPYSERKFIVVIDDKEGRIQAENTVTRGKLLEIIEAWKELPYYKKLLPCALLIPTAPVLAPAAVPLLLGIGLFGIIQGMKEKGVDVLPVLRSQASSLTFPPGHPRILYSMSATRP